MSQDSYEVAVDQKKEMEKEMIYLAKHSPNNQIRKISLKRSADESSSDQQPFFPKRNEVDPEIDTDLSTREQLKYLTGKFFSYF